MLHIIFNRLLASISAHIILIIRQQTVKKKKKRCQIKDIFEDKLRSIPVVGNLCDT